MLEHVEHGEETTMPKKKQLHQPTSGGRSGGCEASFTEQPLLKVGCLSWSQCRVLRDPAVQGGGLRHQQRARARSAPPPCRAAVGEVGTRKNLCRNAEREARAVARPAND